MTEQVRLPTPLKELQRYFEPPVDLAEWARKAAGDAAPEQGRSRGA